MTPLPVDELAPCPLCGKKPRVEREEVSPRKTVYHLHPCCPEIRSLLRQQRPRRGTFYFQAQADEGAASTYIEPFQSKQHTIDCWNKAVKEYRNRPQS